MRTQYQVHCLLRQNNVYNNWIKTCAVVSSFAPSIFYIYIYKENITLCLSHIHTHTHTHIHTTRLSQNWTGFSFELTNYTTGRHVYLCHKSGLVDSHISKRLAIRETDYTCCLPVRTTVINHRSLLTTHTDSLIGIGMQSTAHSPHGL